MLKQNTKYYVRHPPQGMQKTPQNKSFSILQARYCSSAIHQAAQLSVCRARSLSTTLKARGGARKAQARAHLELACAWTECKTAGAAAWQSHATASGLQQKCGVLFSGVMAGAAPVEAHCGHRCTANEFSSRRMQLLHERRYSSS
jgi:hypothetical protein